MPRGSTAAIGGLVAFFFGLAAVAAGAFVLSQHSKALGLGLAGGGFALVLLGSLISAPKTPPDGGQRPPKDA